MCLKTGKWARCPSGQRQAATIALWAACSGIANTRHTYTPSTQHMQVSAACSNKITHTHTTSKCQDFNISPIMWSSLWRGVSVRLNPSDRPTTPTPYAASIDTEFLPYIIDPLSSANANVEILLE